MARHQLCCAQTALAPAGPQVFITLMLLSASLLQPCAAANRCLLSKPNDIAPDVSLPDDAVSVRKAVFDVTTSDCGTHQDLAVFVYELEALAGNDNGPHISHECKRNQDVAVVLLHGATYNHKYWDAPANVDGVEHSFARYLAKQCFYVLAVDILGTGESDKPDGFTTGLPEQTHATADFIRSIKKNNNAARAHKAKKVIIIGHSFGTVQSNLLLGTNPGIADAFVATGWTNGYASLPDLRPVFEYLKAPYITFPTDPNEAPFFTNFHATFYAADNTTWTPAMLAYDVSNLVDYITYPNAIDSLVGLAFDRSNNMANDPTVTFQKFHTDQITVPMFVLCGDQDLIADAAGCATSRIYYPNAASFTTFVQSNIGHVYNLHLTNRPGWEKISEFVNCVA